MQSRVRLGDAACSHHRATSPDHSHPAPESPVTIMTSMITSVPCMSSPVQVPRGTTDARAVDVALDLDGRDLPAPGDLGRAPLLARMAVRGPGRGERAARSPWPSCPGRSGPGRPIEELGSPARSRGGPDRRSERAHRADLSRREDRRAGLGPHPLRPGDGSPPTPPSSAIRPPATSSSRARSTARSRCRA